MSDTEQKTDDRSQTNFSDRVIDIFFLLGILAVAFLWFSIVVYIFYHKNISFFEEFEIAKLGQTGDFFNISTSLASFVTVLIVYRGFLLQKKELSNTSQQLKNQKDSMEKEEQVNRTMKFIDEWEEFKAKKIDKIRYDDVDRFLKKIKLIISHKGYEKKIDCKLIISIITHDLNIDFFEDRISSQQDSIDAYEDNLKRLEKNRTTNINKIKTSEDLLMSINIDYPEDKKTSEDRIQFLLDNFQKIINDQQYIGSSMDRDRAIREEAEKIHENYVTYCLNLQEEKNKLIAINNEEIKYKKLKEEAQSKLKQESDLLKFIKDCESSE